MDSDEVARIEEFFVQYGQALAEGDLERVADCYAYPSLVLGGSEIILISERAEVIGAFTGAAEENRRKGFTRAVPDVRVLDAEATGVVWTAVVWTYASDDGAQRLLDGYRYLVRTTDAALHIAALAPAPTGGQT